MKNNIIFTLIFATVSLTLNAVISESQIDSTGVCNPGKWTHGLDAARSYVKEHKRFMLIDLTKNNGGCGYCNTADDLVYTQSDFLDWSKKNDIPLVHADYSSKDYAAQQVLSLYPGYGATPVMTVVDSDGLTRIGYFYGHGGSVQAASGEAVGLNGYFLNAPLSPATVIGMIEYCINRNDDSVSMAKQIVAADKDVSVLPQYGYYDTIGTNNLSAKRQYYGGVNLKAYAQDIVDWRKFSAKASTSYRLGGFCRQTSDDLGLVFIYDSITAANKGAADLVAATNNAIAYGSMSQMAAQGILFKAASSGMYYIEFTRRAAQNFENLTLEYVFTLQESEDKKYGFECDAPGACGPSGIAVWRSAGYAYATLKRTDSEGEDKISYTLYGYGEDDEAWAYRGPEDDFNDFDYDPEDVEHVFHFISGSDSATIQIPIFNKWYDDECNFFIGLNLSSDKIKAGWTNRVEVTILEDSSIAPGETADEALILNQPMLFTNGCHRFATRISSEGAPEQWWKLTNVSERSIYTLKVDTTNHWSQVSSLRFKVYESDGTTPVEDGEVSLYEDKDYVFHLAPQRSGDFYIRVTPTPALGASRWSAFYQLTRSEAQKPVLSFSQAVVRFDSPTNDVTVSFAITNTVAPIDFDYLVGLKAIDGTVAKAGHDFLLIADVVTNLTCEVTCEVPVSLLDCADGWRGERTFTLQLQPGFYYALGDQTNLTVTLAADISGNRGTGTEAKPLELGITPSAGESTWLQTGDRNVSGGVNTDWICITNVVATDWEYTNTWRIAITNIAGNVEVQTNGLGTAETNTQLSVRALATWTNVLEIVAIDQTATTNGLAATFSDLDVSITNTQEGALSADEIASASRALIAQTAATNWSMTATERKRIQNHDYLLTATDVKIKPESKKNDVFVRVMTNGQLVASYQLVDIEHTPVKMHFDDLDEYGTVTLCVARTKDETVLAQYNIGFRAWTMPTIAFTTETLLVDDTNAVVVTELRRTTEYEDISTSVRVFTSDVSAKADEDYKSYDEVVTFGPGQDMLYITNNLIPEIAGIWTSNRTFKVNAEILSGEEDLWSVIEPKSCIVELNDVDSQFDARDPGDDVQSGATTLAMTEMDDATVVTNTLNGSDTSDWLRFTNIQAGNSYRFVLKDLASLRNVKDSNVFVTFKIPGLNDPVTMTFAEFLTLGYYNTPEITAEMLAAAAEKDILVRIYRNASDKIVSCRYAFVGYAWPWPKISLVGNETVDRDGLAAAYPFFVVRTDNLMMDDPSVTNHVDISAEIVSGKDIITFAPTNVAFAPGVATNLLWVKLNCATNVWTGNWSFKVRMSLDRALAAGEKVKPGDCAELDVVVTDLTEQYDQADKDGDAMSENAVIIPVTAQWKTVVAHLNGRSDWSELPSVGDDNVDWYKFVVTSGKKYRFEAMDVGVHNVSPEQVFVRFYYDPNGQPFAQKTMVQMLSDGYKTETIPSGKVAIYVKIWRPAAGTTPIAFTYTLRAKMQANRLATFAAAEQSVSEKSSVVTVPVVCETEGHVIDLSDVYAVVTAGYDDMGTYPAESPFDFIKGETKTNIWTIGSLGGTNYVSFTLGNSGSEVRWTGDRTFKLTLAADDDTEFGDISEMTVTIREDDPAECGIISIVSHGETSVREGDAFPVRLKRCDGFAGDIDVIWTWTYTGGETVVTNKALFVERDNVVADVNLVVPTVPGFALAQNMALSFTASPAAGSETIKLSVDDADYQGPLSGYSAGDRSKVAFKASGTGWYQSTSGSDVLSTGSGSSVVMSATVKGPGRLWFDVVLVDAEGCTLTGQVSGQVAKTFAETATDQYLDIPTGTKAVRFSFARGTKVAATAAATIANVRFEPAAAFRTMGTFTGSAYMTGMPGLGTLTVSQTGRISGKLQCPDRTWTFAQSGGWTEGENGTNTVTVTAKSKGESMSINLAVETASGVVTVRDDEGTLVAVLYRSPWSDQPMQPDEAATLRICSGYYTMTVRNCCDLGDYGSGYLTMKVSDAGKIRVSGVLADGQNVSMSGQLLLGSDAQPYVYFYISPSSYRKGWFAQLAAFEAISPAGYGVRAIEGTDNGIFPLGFKNWTRNTAQDVAFARMPHLSGGYYDSLANLSEVYATGLKVAEISSIPPLLYGGSEYLASFWGADRDHPETFTFAENSRAIIEYPDGLFSITVRRATGVFSGTLRADYVVNPSTDRTIRRSTTYRGVLTPIRLGDDSAEGRGFMLMPDTQAPLGKRSVDISLRDE